MTATPRLLVIQHELDDPLGELGGPLVDAGLEPVPWFTPASAVPPVDLEDLDGIVSMGAICGVLQEAEHPWMPRERELVTAALERELPVLGVCFGAQLLASCAGARVWKSGHPEVGWCDVTATAEGLDDRITGGLGETYRAMQYHHDTFELPSGATLLARNGDTVEAYRLGERAWGLQYHVEVNPAMAYGWLASYREDMLPHLDLDAFHLETRAFWRAYRDRCVAVGTAFAQVVHEHAAHRSGGPAPA